MCEPCTACGAEVHIPEGLEPTELCNTCAQARVIELEAMVVELRRELNDADHEIWYEKGSGDFDPPYPEEWKEAENERG